MHYPAWVHKGIINDEMREVQSIFLVIKLSSLKSYWVISLQFFFDKCATVTQPCFSYFSWVKKVVSFLIHLSLSHTVKPLLYLNLMWFQKIYIAIHVALAATLPPPSSFHALVWPCLWNPPCPSCSDQTLSSAEQRQTKHQTEHLMLIECELVGKSNKNNSSCLFESTENPTWILLVKKQVQDISCMSLENIQCDFTKTDWSIKAYCLLRKRNSRSF